MNAGGKSDGDDDEYDEGAASEMDLLDEWLKVNSVKKTNTVSNNSDEEGDRWYNNKKFIPSHVSGCERLEFNLASGPREVHFLTEWSLFFNMLAEKKGLDYLQREVPLLQLAWFFFFHKYTIRVTKCLLVYLILSELIAFSSWPGYTLGNTAAFCAAYAAVHVSSVVIKGTGDAMTVTSVHVSKKNRDNDLNPMKQIKVDVTKETVMGSLVEFCKGAVQLMGQLRNVLNQGRKMSKSGAVKVKSFYDVMEAGTEYLATLSSDDKKSFKPKAVTSYMLVFLLIFAAGSGILGTLIFVAQAAQCSGKAFNNTDDYCSRTVFFAIVEIGGLVRFVGNMLMFGNISSGFAALLYGADVANALTRHWLTRFGPFRTITMEDEEDVEDEEKKGDKEEKKEIEEVEEEVEKKGDGEVDKKKKEDQVLLADFQPLIKRDAFERYLFTNYYMSSASTIWGTYLVLMVITNLVLFLYAYFLIVWEIKEYGSFSSGLLISCGANLFMTIFVMACVSYANSAVEKINKSFVYSGVGDYSIFSTEDDSGRRVWIDYVAEAPVYWYIFGFALTRAWLGAFIGGGLSSIAGAALLMFVGLD